MLDFATFPGAILLTKNEIQNIEYLYRGRLFSTDNIIPVGISKLKNKDFQPLIESALQAKGFAKGQTRTSKIIGYNIQDLDTKLDKLISNNPKNIYIIGFSDLRADNLNYFKSFFSDFNDNDCAISFSYNPNKNNVLHINLAYDYPMFNYVMEKIFEKIPVNSDNLNIYLAKCDINSISNIIYLKNRGVKNISILPCPPYVINPSVLKVFMKIYDIKNLCK